MNLFERINEELKTAMKNKEPLRLSVIRMLKSKLLLEDARGNIADETAQKIIATYAKQLKDAVNIAKENNKPDVAAENEAELTIVKEFLPPELSAETVTEIAKKIITETGAADMSAMGRVMGAVMKEAKGADGNLVKTIVTELLKK